VKTIEGTIPQGRQIQEYLGDGGIAIADGIDAPIGRRG